MSDNSFRVVTHRNPRVKGWICRVFDEFDELVHSDSGTYRRKLQEAAGRKIRELYRARAEEKKKKADTPPDKHPWRRWSQHFPPSSAFA